MDRITITTPMPNPDCHAHTSRSGWKKIAATKSDRKVGFVHARDALRGNPPPMWKRASMRQVFFFPRNNGQDLMNFSQMCKPITDGIVDSGIITDDNHTVLRPVILDFGGYVGKEHARVEITITPQPGA